ncbi:Aste57867_15883 [Aphanomyces stellatus]|uniref:Aste57867_15883 protein n=1 Tax=Aphanomyces stellatus TaxID=120398 RepID=A0A485L574_9STRA|nr:hypothetical protein As57867_015827 [Aphanomyces stellatus]VFT92670.1 Aste57867_15883 [Aphanomyces stellatus]
MGFIGSWVLAACAVIQVCVASDGSTIKTLMDDTFVDTIKESNAVWLVDFYAPWCSSCIQLEPTLETAAEEARGIMKFGKVNVDANPELKAKYEIVRYPTLMYGRWNERMGEVELKAYPGDRAVDAFVKFGKRVSKDVVSSISSEKEWQHALSVDGSMLVFGQAQGASDSNDLWAQYQTQASAYHKHHIFTSTSDSAILAKFSRSAPFIARVDTNQNEPYYYDGDLPLDTWMEKNRYPSYTAFESTNFKHIGWFRIMVIGVYIPSKHTAFEKTLLSLASYSASPLPPAARDHFAFGWLDADRYVNYVTKFFVYSEQVPTIFVWNMQDQVFYNYEGPADDAAMADFLQNILAGKEHAIAQADYFLKIYRYIARGYPWTLLWFIPGGLILFLFLMAFRAAIWTHDTQAEKRALEQSQQQRAKPPADHAKKSS